MAYNDMFRLMKVVHAYKEYAPKNHVHARAKEEVHGDQLCWSLEVFGRTSRAAKYWEIDIREWRQDREDGPSSEEHS